MHITVNSLFRKKRNYALSYLNVINVICYLHTFNMAGVYILVRKRHLLPPPSENDIFLPLMIQGWAKHPVHKRETAVTKVEEWTNEDTGVGAAIVFFYSYGPLFHLILPYFAFILLIYCPFSLYLSSFFLFLFHFPNFLFPFSIVSPKCQQLIFPPPRGGIFQYPCNMYKR